MRDSGVHDLGDAMGLPGDKNVVVKTDGVLERVRRIAATPDGPLIVPAVLALLAMVEVVSFGDAKPNEMSPELLLGLSATAPLALAKGRVVAVAVAVTLANLLALAAGMQPTVAAVVAQLIIGYLVGRSSLRRGMNAARERVGSNQVIADTLLEHAARGERARIARELHDVVAHHISLIAVQAETARLTTPGMPPDGARRLVAIGDTARSALTEMRRLLGVLREDAGTEPTRAPQPGLDQLNELIDDARESAGASTRLVVRGQVGPLDPGIELTAYRIVQEALTNARRHAPGAAVDVELHYTAEVLRIRVRDNGPGPPGSTDTGHGLVGMRERAAMIGGTMLAGPARHGGFLIEVVLPVTEDVQ